MTDRLERRRFAVEGLLWSRTRSLPLVVAIHGAADLVPNLTDFARHFHAI